jgi:uncharacterized protein (DUF885 family)
MKISNNTLFDLPLHFFSRHYSLKTLIFFLCFLVVDVGMHTQGWTREQAIQYSLEREAEDERSVTAEIERYMAIPAQALSYKIGQLKIRELRTKAENELGEKFNIAQFHNQVLETGSVPLNILEKKIDRWIAEVNASIPLN